MRTRISLRSYITETKFKGLSQEELDVLKIELDDVKKNENAIKHFDTKIVKNPEYGHKFYVKMKNPFYDTDKFSAEYTGDANDQKRVEDVEEIECIGIADKFGRIFLQNVWEIDEPAYIEFKKAETKTSKNGYKYKTKEGWYLTRKGIKVYDVKTWYSGKRGESPFHFTSEKQSNGVWAKFIEDDVKIVIDLSNMSKDLEKAEAKIAAAKQREDDRAKAEQERLKKEEERKAFWDARKDYKCYGCANAWGDNVPAEVKKAWDDKDAKWFEVEIGNCYRQEWCDTYKLYYSVDSSD